MNILVYTHHYPAPEELGLVKDTKVIHYFAKMLMEKGHRVQVVYLFYRPIKKIALSHLVNLLPKYKDYTYEGVPVHLIEYQMLTPRRVYPEDFQAKLINAHLKKMKAKWNFAADKVFIHFPTTFTGLTETLAGCPCVLGDFHNMDIAFLQERDPKGRMLSFIRQIPTWGYRNRSVRNYMTRTLRAVPVPVYTGIDASLLAPPAFIEEKKLESAHPLRILYAGQLIPLKNVDCLIRAFKQLSFEAELTIIGEGSERKALMQLAADDPRITFTDWLPREEVLDHMRRADVFAMVSSPETYGLVYLEAVAQGCVAIASRGEGFDGLIEDGQNGFLCAPGNDAELADILTRFSAMEKRDRDKLIDGGYALALSMTEDKTTDGFLAANSH